MAATYTMQEMKDLHNENETILYPRMIIKGQCSTEELIEDIAHHTTYNTGELRGMIMALKDAMAREMSRGYSVKLDEIGTFTYSFVRNNGRKRGRTTRRRNPSQCQKHQNTQHQLPCRQRTDSQDGRALHAGKRKRYQQAENFTPLQRKEIENGPGFSDHTPVHDGGGLHGPHRLEPYYRSQGTSEVGNNTRNRHTPQGAAHTQSLCGRHR